MSTLGVFSAGRRSRAGAGLALLGLAALLLAARPADLTAQPYDAAPPPFWQVAVLSVERAPCLVGRHEARVGVLACRDRCAPVPWQLDERDATGRLALERGPEPNQEREPGVLDANDELLWMVDDAGRRMLEGERPLGVECGYEVRLRAGGFERWVYAFSFADRAPRSAVRYVDYDPERDVMTGARVSLGFDGPIPQYLALRPPVGREPDNLLDRIKIRVSARFLGLVPLGRDEDDIVSQFVAWRAGPIRITRRSRQWVRLGWGLRTPIFRTDTSFYRDFAELPVRLRLNFPPAFFFRGIEVRVVLDFRDLRGWRLLAPGLAEPVRVGATDESLRAALNALAADWLALQGPVATLIVDLRAGPSLATLKREVLYREDRGGREPESVRGETPGVGFRLTDWGDVDRGHHWFTATCYAAPPDYDLADFSRQRRSRIALDLRPLESAIKQSD